MALSNCGEALEGNPSSIDIPAPSPNKGANIGLGLQEPAWRIMEREQREGVHKLGIIYEEDDESLRLWDSSDNTTKNTNNNNVSHKISPGNEKLKALFLDDSPRKSSTGIIKKISRNLGKGIDSAWACIRLQSSKSVVRGLRRVYSGRGSYDFENHLNAHDLHTNSSVTMVLSMEHLVKKILSSLGPTDLLKCRAVCQGWLRTSTPLLRSILSLNIWKVKNKIKIGSKLLNNLTKLLSKRNRFRFNTFPCTDFTFNGGNLSNKSIQKFLHTYGKHIRRFSVLFSAWNCNKLEHENYTIDYLKTLLTVQAPNLEYLKLDIFPKVEWHNDLQRYEQSPLRQTDMEFQEIHSDNFIRDLKLNKSLKEFDLAQTPSAKILEAVVVLSPNLEEIDMAPTNYSFLLEPLNRIGYVKDLKMCGYALFKVREMMHSGQLKPTSITFGLNTYFKSPDKIPATIVNGILDSCSNILESIRWTPVVKLNGFCWPSVFPNVTRLHIGSPHCKQDIRGFFPEGSGMTRLFPKLTYVGLDTSDSRWNFLTLLDSITCDPLPSVQQVEVFCTAFVKAMLLPQDLQPISTFFPNASIQIYECEENQASMTKKNGGRTGGRRRLFYPN